MATNNNEWLDLLKHVTPTNVLKTSGVLFLLTLQVLIIIWIIMWMSGNTSQPTVTTTTTVTTPAVTTPTTP